MYLTINAHPLLDVRAFVTRFPKALAEMPTAPTLLESLSLDATAPFCSDDTVREKVRQLLRHGGYKPTGRGKPASEYLLKAVGDKALGSINLAVDACNIASLHSGLPISVIDLDRAQEPFRIAIAQPGDQYVFNASGQSIELVGLLCLFDVAGPCANGVKDAQRTKTSPETRSTLSVIWGTKDLPGRSEQTATWYRGLLESHGAICEAASIG